jgi:hypothetical protein
MHREALGQLHAYAVRHISAYRGMRIFTNVVFVLFVVPSAGAAVGMIAMSFNGRGAEMLTLGVYSLFAALAALVVRGVVMAIFDIADAALKRDRQDRQ